jgi:peptidoglycan hydrolase CwlO-like protein
LFSASIANLFAKEKDELKHEIAEKNDLIDELKLKVYRLENEVSALKQEIKVSIVIWNT